MKNDNERLRRLCVMALLCAMAYAAVALIRIPAVAFLKYEPKDVLLVIGGFLLGPLEGAIMCAVVAAVEAVTISDTGAIGLLMNVLSSCLFVCPAALLYRRHRTIGGAVAGLGAGSLCATAGMLLWNWLITPLYMGVPRSTVVGMLLPVFLPFNLLKCALNATLAVLLYKGVSRALRAARLLPQSGEGKTGRRFPAWLPALFVFATLVVILLVWSGKI